MSVFLKPLGGSGEFIPGPKYVANYIIDTVTSFSVSGVNNPQFYTTPSQAVRVGNRKPYYENLTQPQGFSVNPMPLQIHLEGIIYFEEFLVDQFVPKALFLIDGLDKMRVNQVFLTVVSPIKVYTDCIINNFSYSINADVKGLHVSFDFTKRLFEGITTIGSATGTSVNIDESKTNGG